MMQEYQLKNKNGISVVILSFGAIIKEIITPDKKGKLENIVLSYEINDLYRNDEFFIGALIGRYANRISKACFTLNNERISLDQNESNNHLHGGNNGFHKKYWELVEYDNISQSYVILKTISKNLESGYPGNLTTIVKYSLNQNDQLTTEIFGESDMDTIYNPTSHSYFNLNPSHNSILKHRLRINSEKYIPVNEQFIPIGKLENLKNTPFDFTEEKEIGKDINTKNKQLQITHGYDHCFVFNKNGLNTSELYDVKSGRKLSILTDQPGIQIYTGNHLKKNFSKHQGVCLETQHFPDSPNNENFPTTILRANEKYYTKTSYSFDIN